jgi:hypothetical protein
MADIPEINVVLLNRPEVGTYDVGSEAANGCTFISTRTPR